MKNIQQHKELKEFDLDILKDVLKEKRKYQDHIHKNRKDLISFRGNENIKLLTKKDFFDSKKHIRKLKLYMLK